MNAMEEPTPGLGLAAVILGSVGGVLFFLPVMSVPLAALGVLVGIAGLLGAIRGWTSLRWSLVGIVVSTIALGMGFMLARGWSLL